MENERKGSNTFVTVVITVLVLAVLGLSGYIIYDKFVKKESKPEDSTSTPQVIEDTLKTLDINDKLVTNLVYPKYNDSIGGTHQWLYKDISVENLGRDYQMISATDGIKATKIDGENYKTFYDASEVQASFHKLFGPDVEYKDGDLSYSFCNAIEKYDSAKKGYISDRGCGGDSPINWYYITKIYKAEQDKDIIYTYFYVQPYANIYGLDYYELVGHKFANELVPHDELKSTVATMMDNGEVDTYRWVFKKQSDGNYYFSSANWE